VIPEEDIPKLKEMGAGAIFGPGTPTKDCIQWLEEAVASKKSAGERT
jgi:methylmalonyl-CoA mutase C-terminal domain/subunit